jgi:hypothetical protein
MHRPYRFASLLAIASLAACEDSTGLDSGPSAVQSAQVGAVLQDEVETDIDALMIEAAVTPSFALGAEANGLMSVVVPCAAPSNTTDPDGDGIYTDATIVYAGAACTRTNRRGGNVALTGTLRIQDPTPTTAGLAFSNTLTGLTFTFTGGGTAARNYTVSRTGTRAVSLSGAGFTFASNVTITRTFNVGEQATVEKAWNVSYTPAAGASLTAGQPLPSGTLSATGTVNWTRGTEELSLAVSTPTPLSYSASCNSAQRVTAGEMRAQGVFNGRTGYLRVRWTACGVEPSVTFIAI